jgi:hypothetical protein
LQKKKQKTLITGGCGNCWEDTPRWQKFFAAFLQKSSSSLRLLASWAARQNMSWQMRRGRGQGGDGYDSARS